ncbi:MAG TPA: winged helix-turn-helix domain-containing protein [Patescibacteria group bacterium]|nr:winged helix-turn-helix domain-containing protein [Patescibacteria group bacterium]
MLSELFLSKVRVKLLELFLSQPDNIYYVREIVRAVGEQINAVRAELSRMEKIGLLSSEWRANRKYYSVKKDYLFFDELLRLVNKTTGLGGALVRDRVRLGKIKYAMLSGGYVRGLKPGPNDVELLLVGVVVLPQLTLIVKEQEAKLGREINYTVMSDEEYEFRKTRRDPFVIGLLEKSRVMLIGDEMEMIG